MHCYGIFDAVELLLIPDCTLVRCQTHLSGTNIMGHVDPIKPHFYIVKLRLTGVYIIFLISAQKHRLWVLVRMSKTSEQVPTIYVLSRDMKNIQIFI